MFHLPEHARESRLADLVDQESDWANRLADTAEISITYAGANANCADSHWDYAFSHPAFEHMQWGQVHAPASADKSAIVSHVLRQVYKKSLAHLIRDLSASGDLAFGIGAQLHEDVLEASQGPRGAGDVGFAIPLPTFDHVPIGTLLKFRQDNAESFEAFRESLKTAVRERIASADSERSASDLATEIAEDVITPEVIKLNRESSSMNRLLNRSAGLSAATIAATTVVGLAAATPLVIGPLIGAGLAAVDYRRYLADKAKLELSDMYFIWSLSSRHGA